MCAAAFIDYVGVPLAESGLDVVLYLPDEREWAAGLRYQGCVVYDPRSGDDPPTTTGSLAGSGDDIAFAAEVGDCSGDFDLKGPLLDCDIPHEYEHVGQATLGSVTDPYPEDMGQAATAGCVGVTAGYVQGSAAPFGVVIGRPILVPTRVDWEAGVRSVVCVAAALDGRGAPLIVIGSLAGDWQIAESTQVA